MSGNELKSGARMLDCEHCEKSFDRPSTYQVHLRTHTGERPYVCDVASCGKGFAVRSNLNRHMRVTHEVTVGVGLDEDGEDGGVGEDA